MRLGWERPRSLALRRVLTNRMREYFTYGSVGGAGGNPGSYPAAPMRVVKGGWYFRQVFPGEGLTVRSAATAERSHARQRQTTGHPAVWSWLRRPARFPFLEASPFSFLLKG
jgi:hypothetical protein